MVRSMAKSSCACWKAASFWRSCCKERWNARRVVNEGLQTKLMHMPAEARTRLQQTLERIINDGCDGLICILL